jgi:hypothetical protein
MLLGAGITLVFYAIPGALLVNVGSVPGAISRGAAWGYVVELALVAVALGYLFLSPAARRLAPSVRLLLLSAAWIALGGMAVCNVFSLSVSSLIAR